MVVSQGGVRIERSGTVQQVSCVLRWSHRLGAQAHCLARLIAGVPSTPPVAVLSEIASNPDELGISGDFAAAAEEFVRVLATHGQEANPAELLWVAHHGPFSSYDPAGPETFTEVGLVFDGQRYHDDLSRHRLLTSDEVRQTVTPWGLKPVAEVLADLQHLS